MKIRSMQIGYRFVIGDKKYVRIPEMVIQGHDEKYIINVLTENRSEDEGKCPVNSVCFFHPDFDPEQVTTEHAIENPLTKVFNRYTRELIGEFKIGENANLRGADLCSADLYSVNLRGADLCSADLFHADFSHADLRGSNLRGADLRGADLRGADLRRADLRRADLFHADFSHADLRGADFRGSNLRGADLRGADFYHLSGANNFTQ